MAQKVEIEVEVTKTGEVHLKVKGVKGQSCLEIVKPLEEALGETTEKKLTAEYYESARVAQAKKTR